MILSLIRVRGLRNTIYIINKFITVITYLEGELPDRSKAVAKIVIEAYLIDNLKVNILIRNNILTT